MTNATQRFICTTPGHAHGATNTCYKQCGCRCDSCRELRARKARDYNARRRTGDIQQFTTVEQVRAHLRMLMAHQWRYKDIEKVSGVSFPTIRRISTGQSTKLTVETADAILGTKPGMRHKGLPPAFVDATGSARRLQAMFAQGWTLREMARRLECPEKHLYFVMTQASVTAKTHQRIAALYDELWDKRPPMRTKQDRVTCRRGIEHAVKRGWVGPLAWDDETIDDPEAAPDTGSKRVAIDRYDPNAIRDAIDGIPVELSAGERREVVRVLHNRRWSADRIGEHAGCDRRTVQRIRTELALPHFTPDQVKDAA